MRRSCVDCFDGGGEGPAAVRLRTLARLITTVAVDGTKKVAHRPPVRVRGQIFYHQFLPGAQHLATGILDWTWAWALPTWQRKADPIPKATVVSKEPSRFTRMTLFGFMIIRAGRR